MSLLILNYVPHSSSVLWATFGVLEASSGGIRVWLLAHSKCHYKEYRKLLLNIVPQVYFWPLLILTTSLSRNNPFVD